MSEHEFDKQINDSFGGIGKQRTVLSGTWKTYVENACMFLTDTWRVVACWQEDNLIITTLADSLNTEWMAGIDSTLVSQNEAIAFVAKEQWRHQYPSKRMANGNSDPTPTNAVQSRLWYELWQDGREGEYEVLGGEWKAGDE